MRNHRHPDRRAFTLIELLVVVAILGVLMGLLLSAVQKVRGAAARADCQNQLHQQALALNQYHDANNRYPPGHRSLRNFDLMPLSGWTLSILPYVDQAALHDESVAEYRSRLYPLGPNPHRNLATVVPAFNCPLDVRVRTAQIAQREKYVVAFTSYLGVAGQDAWATDGMLFQNSRTRLTDASDGASNTLLLGERPPSADFQFGWWYAGMGQRGRGTADLILSVREPNMQRITSGSPCGPGVYPFRAAKGFDDPCGMFHFWSPHPGGANFAFADGSVRFLKYSADPIMPALATRAGGESVEIP